MKDVPQADRSLVLSGLQSVMESRVNAFGVSEPQVFTGTEGGSYRLIVELAGISDINQAVAQIGRTAKLDFREVVLSGSSTIATTTGLTGAYLKSAQLVFDSTTNNPQISIAFNDEGATMFADITGRNVGKPLIIFIDDAPISQPTVNERIEGGQAVITFGRGATLQEVTSLASLLNAGALPAPVNLLSQQTISATLGIDSLHRAIYAGLVGTLAVILFMALYYRYFGLFAIMALLIYIVLTLAVFKLVPITMTLSGIAGFILSIGMAVDANILIFERTKEELARGLSRIQAIEEGFRRAWPSIRDSNIATIISSLILYYYTSSFVRGFALTLLLGVLMSMFSAITVTRTFMRILVRNKSEIRISKLETNSK